jgi:hypothetical protein
MEKDITRDEDSTDTDSDSDISQNGPLTEPDPASVKFEFKKIGNC